MSSTTVWSVPGGTAGSSSWPVTTVKPRATPAVGDRDAGRGRHGDRARHAGHHLDPDAVRLAGQPLLAAAPEHVGVAALEPHDGPAGAGPRSTSRSLIASWARACRPGALPTSTTRTVAGSRSTTAARGQPVDDHDVGRGEQLAGAGGEQAVGARARRRRGRPSRGPVARVRRRRSSAPPASSPSTASGDVGGQHRVAGGVRRHGDGAVGGGHAARWPAGSPSPAVRAAGGVEAPDPGGDGVGVHRVVDRRVARPDDDEPGVVEVGRPGVLPCGPGQLARDGQLLELLAQPRRDHVHERAGVDERPRRVDDGRRAAHHERRGAR